MRRWMDAIAAIVAGFLAAHPSGALSGMSATASLPEAVVVDGQPLQRVICSVRVILLVEHYIAGLYIAPRQPVAGSLRSTTQPKEIVLNILSARFLPAEIPPKWRIPLATSLGDVDFARVRAAYEALAAGDVVAITYEPNHGITMRLNAQVVASAPGHHVVDAMVQAWTEGDTLTAKVDALMHRHRC